MKRIATLAAISGVAAVMFAPIHASAESAELRIAGTIVPAACQPAFSNGGVIDYGKIPASSLKPTAQTTLPQKSTHLTLTCDASTLFAFKVVDERAGTAVTSLETISGQTDARYKFGLGAVDGKNTGAYSMRVLSATSDRGYAYPLESSNGGLNWGGTQGGMTTGGESLFAFADFVSDRAPDAYRSIKASFIVGTAIDRGNNLSLNREIPLDGLSTFELVYL